ncbi:hypothetical protein [Streptomyces sp. NPDC002851]
MGSRAASTALTVLAAVGLSVGTLAACSTGGTGARDEGPARSSGEPLPSAGTASASPTPTEIDAVRLVKDDPKVSRSVKADLKPCAADEYPVDVSYGNLTGGSRSDLVVNVLTCGDAIGVGSYVYRAEGGRKYQNVFRAEDTPVYAEIDRGDLVVTRQLYEKKDPVAYPSGEEVITYRWRNDRFAEQYRMQNKYGSAADGATPAPEEN